MGKGDRKTTKGKRTIGSFGNTRKRKKATPVFAPKKKAAKKASKAEGKKAKVDGLNADGNVAGERVSFEQIQQGMKKQSQPVIERSSRRKR